MADEQYQGPRAYTVADFQKAVALEVAKRVNDVELRKWAVLQAVTVLNEMSGSIEKISKEIYDFIAPSGPRGEA